MKTTECLGLPYPECDPPLVKDASDIEQFRDLALAVDAEVQDLSEDIQDRYVAPDAVLMAGAITTTGRDVLHFLNTTIFDNAGMADTAADVIRIHENGWYLIGGYVSAVTTPSIFLRIQPIVNGDMVSSYHGPGFSTGNADSVSFCDVLFLQDGDALQMATHHAALDATSYAYVVQMWALRILVNE